VPIISIASTRRTRGHCLITFKTGDIISFSQNKMLSLPPQFLAFLSLSLESKRMVIPELIFLVLEFFHRLADCCRKHLSQVGLTVGSLWIVMHVLRVF
jgi:hypothetical protein